MNIKHDPLFNTEMIAKHYSEKDGVPVKYVCTSELARSNVPMDIFYRDTPHPTFGNRYFGVFYDGMRDSMMITNADPIEETDFAMVNVDGTWHYSSHRHDYKQFKDSQGKHLAIDGGRAYARGAGYQFFKVQDGEIVNNN